MTDTIGRIKNAAKHRDIYGIATPDKRGKKSPGNKLTSTERECIVDILDNFPKYQTHYTKSEKLYFSPEMTYDKIYQKYREGNKSGRTVCLNTFKSIFKEYKVSIYMLRNDCCLRCDQFKMRLQFALD